MTFLQTITLTTRKLNLFTQRKINSKNRVTPNRYQKQHLNQHFLMKNENFKKKFKKQTLYKKSTTLF